MTMMSCNLNCWNNPSTKDAYRLTVTTLVVEILATIGGIQLFKVWMFACGKNGADHGAMTRLMTFRLVFSTFLSLSLSLSLSLEYWFIIEFGVRFRKLGRLSIQLRRIMEILCPHIRRYGIRTKIKTT